MVRYNKELSLFRLYYSSENKKDATDTHAHIMNIYQKYWMNKL